MTCRFCDENKELRESHIIPKFVFRWLRKTGGEYFRNAENPNKRPQDGYKPRLLCNECEGIFGRWERKFANEIFYPYSDKHIEKFYYDSNLLKFATSVLYRVLTTCLPDNLNNNHFQKFKQSEKEWKLFLKDNTQLKSYGKIHIFLTDNSFVKQQQPVENFLNYYARGIDGALITNSKTALVYAKLARVIIIGEITGFNNQGLKGTLINCNKGIINSSEMKLDNQLKCYLIDRVSQLNELYDKVSEKQRNIALKHAEESINKIEYEDIRKIYQREINYSINPEMLDF